MPPERGVGALLSRAMAAMTTPVGPVAPEVAGVAVRSLCDLLALGIGARDDHRPAGHEALRQARLDQALRIIEARFDDPALGPAEVAAALGISYRALYLLFEPTGATFAQTLAARRLGLSQPAISNALARLRRTLNDPLFVRTAAGMQPTPRAELFADSVGPALQQITAALNQQGGFDPSGGMRRFTLAMKSSTCLELRMALSPSPPTVKAR